MHIRHMLPAITICALTAVSGCTGGSSIPTPGSNATTPVVTQSHHLYVESGTTLASYSLPLTASSTPLVTTTVTTNAGGMVATATQLFVANDGASTSGVDVFSLPLTANATPAFHIADPNGSVEDVALSPTGQLAFALNNNTCCIDVVNPPFSASSTVAFSIHMATSNQQNPWGVTFDSAGNAYVAGGNTNAVIPGPLSASSTPSVSFGPNYDNYGINVDSTGRVFVANGTANGELDVYTAPVTASSTPAFSLTVSPDSKYIGYPSFDTAGNLYVPVYGDNKVFVYTAPITSSSTPAFALPATGAYAVTTGP